MKYERSCPITFEKVDENIVRLQAGLISICGVLYLLTINPLLLALLLYDFFIRIIGYKELSLSVFIAKYLAKQLLLAKKIVDEGPKKFAAQIGLVFVITANILYYSGFLQLSLYTMAILVFCAALESLFGFCVACQIYPLYRKLRLF